MTGTSVTIAIPPGLPLTYVEVCRALAQCARIDECKGWSDKAAALAAYAKMQKDAVAEANFKRIRLRATRRIGELLGPVINVGCRGLSPDDPSRVLSVEARMNARHVARVPKPLFEELTEGLDPPGVNKMAAIGAPNPGRAAKIARRSHASTVSARKWRTEALPKIRGEHILLDFLINRQPARNLTVGEVVDWASRHLITCRSLLLLLGTHDRGRRVGDCVDEKDADMALKLTKEDPEALRRGRIELGLEDGAESPTEALG